MTANTLHALRASALALVCCLACAGCLPWAIASAVSMPYENVGRSIDDVGLPDDGEGLLVGSLAIHSETPGAPIERWGDLDLSVPGWGAAVRYIVRIVSVDRRGASRPDRREIGCRVDELCRFVGRLAAGRYRVRLIQLWGRGSDGVDPGAVLQDLDYSFEIADGELAYLGRLEISRPYLDDEGSPRIALSVSDHRDEDVAAVAASDSVAALPQRTLELSDGVRGPVRYDSPWPWKVVMVPGCAWHPQARP
jgi:hypothetical protein